MSSLQELISKYNQAIPRYTSYPPANHFDQPMNPDESRKWIVNSNDVEENHLAFYVHIPFCKKLCHYCGCNAYKSPVKTETEAYLRAIHQEIDLIKPLLNQDRAIAQIHFGGGTPNSLSADEIKKIIAHLKDGFSFIDNPEIAIECNPAYLDFAYLDALAMAGFNRISLGVQDFDEKVLKGVNREASRLPIIDLVEYLRMHYPAVSVNLDFIYGLPDQSIRSFVNSIEKAIAIRPERLVTFSYAHVPWMKKQQSILESLGLPAAEEKLEMFLASRKTLLDAGYSAIGMDHYVLPEDELAQALNDKKLHRNFQGYCTRRTTGQVYALGVSAISQFDNAYLQNEKDWRNYILQMDKKQFAHRNGRVLLEEEKIIRELINQIMCNHYVDFGLFAEKIEISTNELFRILDFQDQDLHDFREDHLLEFEKDILSINETGRLFIRNIANRFDPFYRSDPNRYSLTV